MNAASVNTPAVHEQPTCTCLTEDEYGKVRLHSYYTGQILSELSSSPWFADIVNWSKHHHEKLNGKGYPYLIPNEEMDTGIKIIAYADVISALMEDRPYRECLGINETMRIIREKVANDLDTDIFAVIERNKYSLCETIEECHRDSLKAYSQNIC